MSSCLDFFFFFFNASLYGMASSVSRSLSLVGKGHNDLALRSYCGHAVVIVLGREIGIDRTSLKNIYYDFFFIVSVVVECSNIDIDAKIFSKESLIMQSCVKLNYKF